MSQRRLYVGLDIYDDYTYMSVIRGDIKEPEIFKFGKDEKRAIPTLCYAPGTGEVIDGFMRDIFSGKDIIVKEKKADPVLLLASFFSRTLTFLRNKYPTDVISSVVVTTEFDQFKFYDYIYTALERIGIKKDRAMVVGHRQAFVYYVINQPKEYWVNNVGLFDYSREKITYYNMRSDSRRRPVILSVEEKDYSEFIPMYEDDTTEIDEKNQVFLNMANGAIHGKIMTSIYMMGDGFDTCFADKAMQEMALNKHIFRGMDIYVKGACYQGVDYVREEDNTHVYLDENMTLDTLSTKVYNDAEKREIILAKAGVPWYQVDMNFDIIPDGDDMFEVDFKNIITGAEQVKVIKLDGINRRLNRETRINVSIRFDGPEKCIITLRDKGFGDFIPSSYRIWEEEVELRN